MMNIEWASSYLKTWLQKVDAEWSEQGGPWLHPSPAVSEIVEGSEVVAQIVREALSSPARPDVVEVLKGRVIIDRGATLARRALGALEMREESISNLGPAAPAFLAESFHQLIWSAVAGLWEEGHFRVALAKAATYLNAEVQSRVNRSDVSDVALMQETFSDADPQVGKPRLRWPGPENDLTVRTMRTAVRHFAVGCFAGIRNVSIHTAAEMPRQEALENLAALSMLARWIDKCELLSLEGRTVE